MSENYWSVMTNAGIEYINTQILTGNEKLITNDWSIALGTGNLEPTGETTELKNKIFDKTSENYGGIKFGYDAKFGHYAEILLPNTLAGQVITEAGLYNADGLLVAAAKTYIDLTQAEGGLELAVRQRIYVSAVPANVQIIYTPHADLISADDLTQAVTVINNNITQIQNTVNTITADLSGKEDVTNKVGTLDASETHYPSCAAVSAALTKVNYNTRCTFNSGNTDSDGDADILHADGVQNVTETWTQPVLTANGTLGEGDFSVSPLNAGSYGTDLYKMFDGKTTRTGNYTEWGEPITAQTGKGIEFYTTTAIKVGNITVVQSAYACGDFDLFGSSDGQNWTQIGTGLTFPHVQYATEICAVNSDTAYNYHKIIFTAGYNTQNTSFVISPTEITITAVSGGEQSTADTLTFNVAPGAPLVGTLFDGEKIEITGISDVLSVDLADGTYNVFAGKNGAEVLKNTIYRQKKPPTPALGDVWLDLSVEPITFKKAENSSYEVKSDAEGFKKVENLFHSSFDVSKFVLTGEPTISANGVASGFSTGNFPRAQVSLGAYDSWVLFTKIKTGENASNIAVLAQSDAPSLQITLTNGKFNFAASSDGATWDIAASLASSTTLEPETEYFVKLEFTGNAYKISVSTDGDTFVECLNVSSTAKLYTSAYLNIGTTRSANVFFNGAFDLKYFSVYGDNALVFSGNPAGSDTVGEVQIPYTKALSGEKIVTAAARSLISGISGYYSIDELSKTYSHPVGIAFAPFDKLPLGTFTVSSGLIRTYSTFAYNQNGYNVNVYTQNS